MNIEDIRKIPITDFLARMGHEPTARKGNEWWYSAPYREERTPSFRVNILKNVWQDFGIGRGGDIFSLAGEIIGSGDFKSQAKFISESLGGIVPEIVFRPKEKCFDTTPGEENCFVNVRIEPLNNKILLNYLKERGICSDVALPNCEEVRYTLHGKRYFSSDSGTSAVGMSCAAACSRAVCRRRTYRSSTTVRTPVTFSRGSLTISHGWCSAWDAAMTTSC